METPNERRQTPSGDEECRRTKKGRERRNKWLSSTERKRESPRSNLVDLGSRQLGIGFGDIVRCQALHVKGAAVRVGVAMLATEHVPTATIEAKDSNLATARKAPIPFGRSALVGSSSGDNRSCGGWSGNRW